MQCVFCDSDQGRCPEESKWPLLQGWQLPSCDLGRNAFLVPGAAPDHTGSAWGGPSPQHLLPEAGAAGMSGQRPLAVGAHLVPLRLTLLGSQVPRF